MNIYGKIWRGSKKDKWEEIHPPPCTVSCIRKLQVGSPGRVSRSDGFFVQNLCLLELNQLQSEIMQKTLKFIEYFKPPYFWWDHDNIKYWYFGWFVEKNKWINSKMKNRCRRWVYPHLVCILITYVIVFLLDLTRGKVPERNIVFNFSMYCFTKTCLTLD